jgi:hypothetical protein
VRLDTIPLVLKASGMPTLERGARVRLAIAEIDLMAAEAKANFVEMVELPAAETADAAFTDAGEEEAGG